MTNTEWLGKRPTNLAPLTREWFIMATQAHRHQDGTNTYVLTPPEREAVGPWVRVIGIGVLVLAAAGSWAVWGFSR